MVYQKTFTTRVSQMVFYNKMRTNLHVKRCWLGVNNVAMLVVYWEIKEA